MPISVSWVQMTPVASIVPAGADDFERIGQVMSSNKMPVGLGRLISRYADDFNVRADVCLAIAMKETGRFHYGGKDPVFSADPSYHNFGGIKTTDSTATHHFATDALGAVGLVAHVAWYAHRLHVDPRCTTAFDPRHFDFGHKGQLVVVTDLGRGVWNTSADYADGVLKLLNEMWSRLV